VSCQVGIFFFLLGVKISPPIILLKYNILLQKADIRWIFF